MGAGGVCVGRDMPSFCLLAVFGPALPVPLRGRPGTGALERDWREVVSLEGDTMSVVLLDSGDRFTSRHRSGKRELDAAAG